MDYNEFLLIWGMFGQGIVLAFGFGYLWGYLKALDNLTKKNAKQ